jgi:hypothetical protein
MMPIKNLNGGKTFPKRGRLGSGAYYPAGVPIRGNIFGPNTDQALKPTPPVGERPFGSPSNAGNGTQFGQNRATTGVGLVHPWSGANTVIKQNFVAPFTISGTGDTQSPFGVSGTPVIQPHERNTLPHRKIFGVYHTVSGASRAMPSDTAFHRNPPKENPKPVAQPQTYTLRLARAIPSFVSRNNLWVDPNNSFLHGHTNVSGDRGRGRWSTVKKGAAG